MRPRRDADDGADAGVGGPARGGGGGGCGGAADPPAPPRAADGAAFGQGQVLPRSFYRPRYVPPRDHS